MQQCFGLWLMFRFTQHTTDAQVHIEVTIYETGMKTGGSITQICVMAEVSRCKNMQVIVMTSCKHNHHFTVEQRRPDLIKKVHLVMGE